MTLEIYTELKKDIDTRLDISDIAIQSFSRNEMGLVEVTDEYRTAKRRFDIVFNELRVLNKNTPNKVKREYAMNKRFAKIKGKN